MKHNQEDWLFIITTDHGRNSINGKEHDYQSDRERTTWIITNNQLQDGLVLIFRLNLNEN